MGRFSQDKKSTDNIIHHAGKLDDLSIGDQDWFCGVILASGLANRLFLGL
jgi:hypothetical protein